VLFKAMRRRFARSAAAVFYCGFVMSTQPVVAAPEGMVTVSPDAQGRLGIVTVSPFSTERNTQVAAFARVLDPGPLAQLCSDLFAAEATAAASRAEARRSTALHAADSNMSAKDTDAAIAQAKSDETKRLLLRQRLGLEWGPGIAQLADSKLKKLIQVLAKGSSALVHVDTPSNEGQENARTVDIDVGSESLKGVVLGPARVAEPRLSSSGLLVEVSGPSAVLLSVGLIQSAHIDTSASIKGVLLPREALVRYRGSTWAYVKQGADRFQRRLVQDGAPEDGGLFVPNGFSASEHVVAHGSVMLFAIEQGQAPTQPTN
jgi:hypothetical protein